MERTMRRGKPLFIVAFAFFAVFLLLASSFGAAYASSARGKVTLPDFLIRFAEYKSKGNATEEAMIINQMITQEQIKQEMIASTKGAVLTPSSSSQSTSWLMQIWWISERTYDSVTGACVGYISNAIGLDGYQTDGNYAYFFTDGWNEVYTKEGAKGGEAFAGGPMYNYWGRGNVYVEGAYTDRPNWSNYVIIYIGNDTSCKTYLGYTAVTSSTPSTFYAGYARGSFKYMSVMCWTPPPYPTYYSPLIMNSVYIDCVRTLY